MIRLLALSAMLAALGVSLGGASPASAAPYRGAMIHAMTFWAYPESDNAPQLDLLQNLGGNVTRVGLRWEDIQPTPDAPPHETPVAQRLDRFIAEAKARGVSVVLMFAASPCWAADRPAGVPCSEAWRYPPKDPSRYSQAAAWAAKRWGRDLAAFEVWNEPNIDGFLAAPADKAGKARVYADLLRRTYPEVKGAAPDLPVLAGALSEVDVDFMRQVIERGAGDSFDAVSVHPYIGNVDPTDGTLARQLDQLHALLVEHGLPSDLWATEFGYESHSLPEATQARWDADAFRVLDSLPYMRASIIYALRDTSVGDHWQDHYGLVTADLQPKAAYAAVRAALTGEQAPRQAPPSAPSSPSPVAPMTTAPATATATSAPAPTAVAAVASPRAKAKPCKLNGRRVTVRGASCRWARTVLHRFIRHHATRRWSCAGKARIGCSRRAPAARIVYAR